MLQIAYMLGIMLVFFLIIAIGGGSIGLIPFFMARKRGYGTMGGLCLILCMAAPFIGVGAFGGVLKSVMRKLYDIFPSYIVGDIFGVLIPSGLVSLICVIVILIRSKIAVKKEKENEL